MTTGFDVRKYGDSEVVIWSNLKADSDGVTLDCMFLDVLTASFEGNFGNGAEVVMEGSAGGKFFRLETPHGGIVSSMTEGIESIYGRYLSVRPRVINGTDETNITVYLFCDTIKKRRMGK